MSLNSLLRLTKPVAQRFQNELESVKCGFLRRGENQNTLGVQQSNPGHIGTRVLSQLRHPSSPSQGKAPAAPLLPTMPEQRAEKKGTEMEINFGWLQTRHDRQVTLGTRDFTCAVSGFGQVFICFLFSPKLSQSLRREHLYTRGISFLVIFRRFRQWE